MGILIIKAKLTFVVFLYKLFFCECGVTVSFTNDVCANVSNVSGPFSYKFYLQLATGATAKSAA
jgi:hypothetical protein